MQEMILTDRAVFYPGMCACGTSEGPFVDTGYDYSITAETGIHVYVCERCLRRSVAAHGGYVATQVAEELQEELTRARDAIAHLTAEVEEARAQQNRVVSVDDLDALADKLAERSLAAQGRRR